MSEAPRRTLLRSVALALETAPDGTPRASGAPRDVLVEGDVVARVADAGTLPDDGARVIDAAGLVALPGFTDLYGRLREPGPSGRGTLASETRAALGGGFTSVVCAPDTEPAIDSAATVELIARHVASAPAARVLPLAALTAGLEGRRLAELATLQAGGCVAASQADRPIADTGVLFSAMRYAAGFGLPLVMTARDAHLGADGCAHEGRTAARLGLPGIPVAAETVALARLIELCRESGCRLHVSRLSSARGVALVAAAKREGLPLSADVAIHHLLFTDAELAGFDARYRSAVPFRDAADRAALRRGLADGTIDAICSDHAPHDGDARLAPFPACEPGLAAYDHFLPLLLALPALLGTSFARVLDAVTAAPARLLGLGGAGAHVPAPAPSAPHDGGGTLVEGMTADLIVLDPTARAAARAPASAGRNTPLDGVDDLAECTGERAPLRGAGRLALVGGDVRLDAR